MILSTLSPSPLGTPTRVRAVIIHPKVKIELQQLGLPGHPTFPPFARTRERVYLHAFLRSLPLHWTLLHPLLPSFRIQHAKPSPSSSVCAEVHHHLSSPQTHECVHLSAFYMSSTVLLDPPPPFPALVSHPAHKTESQQLSLC